MSAGPRAAWERAVAALDAGEAETARRWLERARRLAPGDEAVALALGSVLLQLGEAGEAERVLDGVEGPDAWALRAAARLAQGEAAGDLVTRALQASVPTPALAAVADAAAEREGAAGWIGLDLSGRVRWGARAPDEVRLDGVPLDGVRLDGVRLDGVTGGTALPPGWERAERLEAAGALGSPVPVQRIVAVAGFVEACAGGVSGWAYHPADPAVAPVLRVGGRRVVARGAADGVPGLPALARPLRFTAAAAGPRITVTDGRGRALLGSPVLRGGPSPPPMPMPMPMPGRARGRAAPVTVVVPVHGGGAVAVACLESVLAHTDGAQVHVVEDGAPGAVLGAALAGWERAGRIRVTRHAMALGFPAAANAGMAAAAGDVVLLNSDTLVPPGWLARLQAAAGPDVASVTPLSNEGSIVSFPLRAGGFAMPDLAGTVALDRAVQAANGGAVAPVPVGVGFCLYMRRAALERVGGFDAETFAQGYGEEVDWCLRAAASGWRHVAALDVFVAHRGGHSFAAGSAALRRRNDAIVARRYPGFAASVAAHHAADPLFGARRRAEMLLWAAAGPSVLLVTHGAGGGVAEFVAMRAEAAEQAGAGRAIVLRPAPAGCVLDDRPDLRFALPGEAEALADLLRRAGVARVEVHHLLGHAPGLTEVLAGLGVPIESWAHDAAAFCPRLSLVGADRRYCGEPAADGCERCVGAAGHHWHEAVSPAGLRALWGALFAASRTVFVPSADAARRLRRQMPAVAPVVAPLEAGPLPPLAPAPEAAVVRVVVPGAIGVEKGFDVLLGCARDAAARALPLEFVVCGYTEDDAALMAAGPVFVTGPYAAAEAVELIRAQRAALAFVPSIWPETWCFALTRAWQAGLFAVAFDLGAQAERIRAEGRGALLPLALPAPGVNEALLRLARLRRGGQECEGRASRSA